MAERICDNCMSPVPMSDEKCPKCGISFENTNPGGALPNGWLLARRYTIGRYLDIDGEGVLYSAIDGNNLQRVLIKEFMPVTLCAARTDEGAIKPKPGCEVLYKTTRADFSELYSILLRMGQTEGLVQVLDWVEENNTAYAVLEKVEGPTLAEYLTKRAGSIDPARALALMRPVLNGVDMLHTSNLVHRGISPENIILESGGTAKLCGFGTLALRQQGNELKPKLYAGYSAPEQYAASEFEGRYTDIYALGAVFYRLVTGYPPFAANERRAQDALRPARQLSKDVPGFLSAGIARAMRILPAERIQTVSDLRLALSGQGGGDSRGSLGLTRQQIIIGACAISVAIVAILVILLVSIFTGGGGDDSSASASSSASGSSSASSSASTELHLMTDLVNKKYEDVVDNAAYTTQYGYVFAEPEMQYSLTVEEGRIISQTPAANTPWDGTTPIRLVVSKGAEPVAIPDLVTVPISQGDAITKLRELNIEYQIIPRSNTGEKEPGMVLETDPVAGTMYTPNKDNPVLVYIAGDVALVPMPSMLGLSQTVAESTLTEQSIQYRVQTVPNSEGLHMVGIVASTDPPAGESIATGATIVNLNVYGPFYMPDLTAYGARGQSPTSLENFLNSKGIGYTYRYTANTDSARNGTIDYIDYVVNAEVTASTVVTIHIYDDATPAPSSSSST